MSDHCLYCDAAIREAMTWTALLFGSEKSPLCSSCLGKLERIGGPVCMACSRPLYGIAAGYIHEDICHDCFRWEKEPQWQGVLDRNLSIYRYNNFLKEVLARYKYRGDYVLAKAFAQDIRSCLAELAFDVAVPIPLSRERLLERGFNQAAGLAVEAGCETADALVRLHGEKQSKKSREERIHLAQVFDVVDAAIVGGKTVLLIDDIYTTGSTLRHAAHALRKAGAKSVSSFTLARG